MVYPPTVQVILLHTIPGPFSFVSSLLSIIIGVEDPRRPPSSHPGEPTSLERLSQGRSMVLLLSDKTSTPYKCLRVQWW